ncbi:hypothetical protein EV426DRAFT_575423 [Tirmania nivea]|nr:hypothetical protein EV426DRAFT_575423 [Tirmania nivea]
MSTLSVPSKSSEGTFSYAAAASGKHSPKPTTVQNPSQTSPQISSSGASTPNGISGDNTKGQASVTTTEARSTPKQKTSNASLSAANSTATVANGESSPSPNSLGQKPSNNEKSSSGEKGSQAEGDKNDINKQPASGELARERLVPAPPPSVNIWNVRAEEFKAKTKQLVPTPVAPPVAASKSVSSKAAEKPTEAKQADRKRGSKHTDSGSWDTEKIREGGAHDRKDAPKDGRDRRKGSDAGRVNGYLSREDGNIRHGKSGRHVTRSSAEKETAVAELPPSLGDATSWPTPEIAQDEEKKEKERLQAEKEKEKSTVARSSGPTKFVPAPFTPTIVHNSPLPTKSGRGGRGGRGNTTGRGGNPSLGAAEGRQDKVDKSEKSAGANSLPQIGEDRGRIGSRGNGLNVRGNYHGSSRGEGRRTGSVGSNPQRKIETPANSSQEKRDSKQPVASKVSSAVSENTPEAGFRAPSQPGEVRLEEPSAPQQPEDDGAFIGQGVIPPQYPERTKRVHSHSFSTPNGQCYQKVDGLNTQAEGYPQGRSERGSVSARGGYRGRGNHYNTSQPHASHSNSIPSQAYHPQHNQGQYPPHTQSYRGYGRGSRGHSTAPRGYHQSYQSGAFPNQQFPQPYPGYYEYMNPMNNLMNSLPSMNMNNGNSPPVPDDPLAHRDYPHGLNAHIYYANVLENVATQMNYYFSVDNLCRDIWLRKQMDSNGWINLSVFSKFSLIRKQTHNMHLLRDACAKSSEIEVQLAADGCRVRKKHNFQLFVLPKEDRAPEVQQREDMEAAAAKEEPAPESAQHSESGRSQMSAAAQPFEPALHQKPSLNSLQSAPPVLNGAPVPTVADSETNGIQRRHSQLSADAAEFTMPSGFTPASPVPQTELQTTDFPDEQIGHIIIVYKKSLLNNTISPGGSPAVNGEISSTCNSDDGTESCQCSPRSGRLSRHGVGWTLDQDPEDPNLYRHEHEEYTKIQNYSLQKRLEGDPDAAKITILCRFWSHFLLNQFNRKMYEDFKSFAIDDAAATGGLSLEILFGFYEAIHVTGSPRDELTRDFVELARRLATNGSNVGLSRLENTLNNPNLRPEVGKPLRGLANKAM